MKTENSSPQNNGERRIRIVTPTPKIELTVDGLPEKEKHVAYGRTSTKEDEQKSSYEEQERYWNEKLGSDESINYLGFFADRKSGKSMKTRPDFMRMMQIVETEKVNRIWTKSVSRFSRNLTETLETVKRLRAQGTYITFEGFNIDTKDEASLLILKIAAMIAEEELRNISANIKWSVDKRFERGKACMSGKMYGYLINNKREQEATEFEIIPWEATIIQQIYRAYLAGKTINEIANDLTEREIPTPLGKKKWQITTVQNILKNEKYAGDIYNQKTILDAHGKRVENKDIKTMVIVENNHLPIIEREVWKQVQAEMAERERTNQVSESGGRYSSKYPFTFRSECICGSRLRRHAQWHGDKKTPIWVCKVHQADRTACAQKPIKETDLERAFIGALEQAEQNKTEMLTQVREQLEAVIAGTAHLKMDDLQEQLEAKQQELLDHNKSVRSGKVTAEHAERGLQLIADTATLRENIALVEKADQDKCLLEYRIKMLDAALVMSFATFNADLFRLLIDRVIMIDKNTLRFIFKGGWEIEQKLSELKKAA